MGKLGMEYVWRENWGVMIIEREEVMMRDFEEKDGVGLVE